MLFLINKNTTKVGDIIDYIELKSINKDRRVMFNFNGKIIPITMLGINDDLPKKFISITLNKNNTTDTNSFYVSDFVRYIKECRLDSPVTVLESDYVYEDLIYETVFIGIKTLSICEKTGNLILGY